MMNAGRAANGPEATRCTPPARLHSLLGPRQPEETQHSNNGPKLGHTHSTWQASFLGHHPLSILLGAYIHAWHPRLLDITAQRIPLARHGRFHERRRWSRGRSSRIHLLNARRIRKLFRRSSPT